MTGRTIYSYSKEDYAGLKSQHASPILLDSGYESSKTAGFKSPQELPINITVQSPTPLTQFAPILDPRPLQPKSSLDAALQIEFGSIDLNVNSFSGLEVIILM